MMMYSIINKHKIINISASLVTGVLIGWVLCIRNINNLDHYRWLDQWQLVSVPERYRPVVGMDSIQIFIGIDDKWKVNFCYPNKWERNKFKLDSLK